MAQGKKLSKVKIAKMKVPVVLYPCGTREQTVDLATYPIPDVWFFAQTIRAPKDKKLVLDLWYLAHSLKAHILKQHEAS